MIHFPDGTSAPILVQGTWQMGEDPTKRADELAALQAGLDLGRPLLDTAEMYANGGAERLVGEAIRGRRAQVFLVSKAHPQNASHQQLLRACEASLRRLGTDYLALYLLHWRGPLAETVEAVEGLVASLFTNFGIVFDGHSPVFLAGNHGRGSGLLNLGAHVVGIVGMASQHGLAGLQVLRSLFMLNGRP